MDNPFSASLLITVIGMAVVFVAMGLFYASMHLLTALFRDRGDEKAEPVTVEKENELPMGDPLRAAAVAVALARAELPTVGDPFAELTISSISSWGDFYRHRQLRPTGRGRLA